MNIYMASKSLRGIGGGQLLIERLSRSFVNEQHSVVILYSISDLQMLKRLKDTGAILRQVKNWESVKLIKKNIKVDTETKIITFTWAEYIKFQNIKNPQITTILYAIHFKGLLLGFHSTSFLKRKVAKKIVLPIIRRGIVSKNIFCMDEQTVNCTVRHYNGKIPKPEIVRIPVDYADMVRRKREPAHFNILSIARAVFPFKGYLLGLVELFVKLKEKYPWVTLTIVSYGDDIGQLKEKIQLAGEYANDIKLVGRTDFEQLESYFHDADVYIGMGTTILDASQRGIPSMPVVAYEEKVYVSHWFHEAPYVLAVDKELQEITDALQKIESIIHMGDEEYQEYANLSHNVVVENYSTDIISQRIIELSKQAASNKPSILVKCILLYMNRYT